MPQRDFKVDTECGPWVGMLLIIWSFSLGEGMVGRVFRGRFYLLLVDLTSVDKKQSR